MKKPKTSWQTAYTNKEGERILRVHVSNDPKSDVYFEGPPHWYDGTATHNPLFPSWFLTGDYKRYIKHIKKFGEHPEVTKERLACYKTKDAKPFVL